MASGRLVDYLGKGLAADRPVSLSLHPDALGLYYSTDTGDIDTWDGSMWNTVVSGSGDVVGPASSTDSNVALFDGITGKLLKDGGTLGTAAFSDDADFATAAQGTTADSAVQPGDLAAVATSGDATDLAYDNVSSGLTATTTQDAIDEIVANAPAASTAVITEAAAFTVTVGTHDGLGRYIRAADDATFDSAESYITGMVFNIRATAAMDLVGDGVTLTAPYGGTLSLDTGMAVTVIMTSATAGDVIGQTVPV